MIKKKRNMQLLIVFVTALLIGVGYAILNSSLNIAGNTKIGNPDWDVHFENVNVTSGSVSATTPSISNGTNVTYTVTLNQPGDFYEFTVDVKNGGTIDAMIGSVSNTGLTTEQKKYMEYTATYSDNVNIEEKQELKANTKETIKVRVKFRDNINVSELPAENKTATLVLSMNYVQANNTSKIIRNIVCRRATTLHTETCTNTNASYCLSSYNEGDTITYGSLGTSGILASGDAFDCDVNGDGTYNATNERFYYVSDLDTNNNYGVLIYYNNVSGGEPSNTTGNSYDSAGTPQENGPITLLPQLPTTTQWKNVSLSNTIRKMKDEKGTEYVDFSYEGYAARLLTYQEVKSVCGSVNTTAAGYLDSCKYLLENTKYSTSTSTYGYWLENPNVSDSSKALFINSLSRRMVSYSALVGNSAIGTRPTIEVPKSKISY